MPTPLVTLADILQQAPAAHRRRAARVLDMEPAQQPKPPDPSPLTLDADVARILHQHGIQPDEFHQLLRWMTFKSIGAHHPGALLRYLHDQGELRITVRHFRRWQKALAERKPCGGHLATPSRNGNELSRGSDAQPERGDKGVRHAAS